MVRLIVDTREQVPPVPQQRETLLSLFLKLCELLFLVFLLFVATLSVVFLLYCAVIMAEPWILAAVDTVVEYPVVSAMMAAALALGCLIGCLM